MSCVEVRNIKVRSLSVDFHEVTWEVTPTREDIFDYTFQVLRSEAPAGPWEPISAEMEDRYLFIDNRIKVANRWRSYYYLIRVKRKSSGETNDFGPADRGADPDLIATEIRKHINLLMREFVGRRCWVLPVRTFGQRCPSCFNETLKSRVRSGCRTCYDTGFVRGYHNPIEAWIQFDPSANDNQQTNIGELQQNTSTLRMGYFPPLKPKDLIIEPENHRWRVMQSNSTERLRAPVHQEVQAHEIPVSDSEYLIELDLGSGRMKGCDGETVQPILFKDLFLVGSRNFTNPQTLDAFERDEIPGIFSLYGSTYPEVKS